MQPIKILVSACLMGLKARYDGRAKASPYPQLQRWQQQGRLVILCPELAAGLPVPRPPAEIVGGDGVQVLSGEAQINEISGQDVTAPYQLAAWLALAAAQQAGCRAALMADGSPTCGRQFIYNGCFNGTRREGMGVAAALLEQHQIRVFSEQQLPALIAWVEEQEKG